MLRRLAWGFIFAIAPLVAFGQTYGRMEFSLQNAQGQAISGASINVYTQTAGGAGNCGGPAGPQAQLFHTSAGQPMIQPLHTDGFGHNYAYMVAGLCYTVTYNSPSTGLLTYVDQAPQYAGTGGPPGPQGPPGTAGNPAAPAFAVQFANSGATQFNADSTITVNPTTHTITAPNTSSSVNAVLFVKSYGALCDGSTDDQTAIQAAFTDAIAGSSNPLCTANGCSIQFPAGTCLTSTIVWKGQSFFGAGRRISYIQGKPGKDVFQVPDTSGSWPFQTTVHDLSILVDVTVNAASSAVGGNNTFPNRIAGTVQNLTAFTVPIATGAPVIGQAPCGSPAGGMTATATSTTVTLSCTNGSFNSSLDLLLDPSLVIGAPITIQGAGTAGGLYTSTITAINSSTCDGHHTSCTVTVADPIVTSVTTALGTYLSTHNPPWYIGNAGMAFQCSNGNSCYGNAYGMSIYNIEFLQTGSSLLYMNHCAGIFTQMPPYASRFNNIHFWSLYAGYAEAAPVSGAIATPDTTTFHGMDFSNDLLPFITYNGNNRVLTDVNIYQETPLSKGPFFLNHSQTVLNGAGIWTINSLYDEGGPSTSGEWSRFMGGPMHITSMGMGGGSGASAYVEFYAGGGSTVGGALTSGMHFDVSNSNIFHLLQPLVIVDNGLNNKVEFDYLSNNQFMGHSFFTSSTRPPRPSIGSLDGSFLVSGNSGSPYLNASDLVTTCSDWPVVVNPGSTGGAAGTCPVDAAGTEITRGYYHSNAATTILSLSNTNLGTPAVWWSGSPRTFGSNVPQTKVNVLFLARCVGAGCAATGNFHIYDNTTGISPLSTAFSLTSAWSLQSVAFDLSATTFGNVLNFRFDSIVNSGTNWDLAFLAIQPIPKDFVSIPNIQITTGTTLIAANTCTSNTAATMTGALTTSAIAPPTPTSDTSAVTGWGSSGGLSFTYYVTANTFNWRVCNSTASPITPGGSVTWNVGAN